METSPPTEDAVPVTPSPGTKGFQKQVIASSQRTEPVKFSLSPKEQTTPSPSTSPSPHVSPIFFKKRVREEEPQKNESDASSSSDFSSDFDSKKIRIAEPKEDKEPKTSKIELPKPTQKPGILVVDKKLFAKKSPVPTPQIKETTSNPNEQKVQPPTPGFNHLF